MHGSCIPLPCMYLWHAMTDKQLLVSRRARIIARIKEVDDASLIAHIDGLLDPGSDAWWSSLPAKVKKSVEKGLAEADRGEFVPDEEASRARAKWRGR